MNTSLSFRDKIQHILHRSNSYRNHRFDPPSLAIASLLLFTPMLVWGLVMVICRDLHQKVEVRKLIYLGWLKKINRTGMYIDHVDCSYADTRASEHVMGYSHCYISKGQYFYSTCDVSLIYV